MPMKIHRVSFLLVLFLTVLCSPSFAAEPIKPGGGDKCPVCGMFVAKYPDFVASIIFKDGSYCVFDGAKDMFKYYLDLAAYKAPGKKEDIESIYVTDY
jgi:copper chaperone NosL